MADKLVMIQDATGKLYCYDVEYLTEQINESSKKRLPLVLSEFDGPWYTDTRKFLKKRYENNG